MLICFVGDLLQAFSNITRIKIIICLGEKEKNVTRLIDHCNLSQSALSQHLAKLRDAGIVECERKGKEIIYSVKDKDVVRIAKEIYKKLEKQNVKS